MSVTDNVVLLDLYFSIVTGIHPPICKRWLVSTEMAKRALSTFTAF